MRSDGQISATLNDAFGLVFGPEFKLPRDANIHEASGFNGFNLQESNAQGGPGSSIQSKVGSGVGFAGKFIVSGWGVWGSLGSSSRSRVVCPPPLPQQLHTQRTGNAFACQAEIGCWPHGSASLEMGASSSEPCCVQLLYDASPVKKDVFLVQEVSIPSLGCNVQTTTAGVLNVLSRAAMSHESGGSEQ